MIIQRKMALVPTAAQFPQADQGESEGRIKVYFILLDFFYFFLSIFFYYFHTCFDARHPRYPIRPEQGRSPKDVGTTLFSPQGACAQATESNR